MVSRKRPRTCRGKATEKPDLFGGLPEEVVVTILCKLSATASCPSDLINATVTCKRLNRLGLHPLVLSKAGPKALAVKASNWSNSAHRFLQDCVAAGNTEACYTLGMILFYCLQYRATGTSLLVKAATQSHPAALYALAVIQFNGSGVSKSDKDLRAGVNLCARAAILGHIDALREIGHCLQDGYGVSQNIAEGRRLLVEANARELMQYLSSMMERQQQPPPPLHFQQCSLLGCLRGTGTTGCPLLSDFGYNVRKPETHPVNAFLIEWFGSVEPGLEDGLRLCSYVGCGRPETRLREFRRCSVCGKVNYCSRACQALDWKSKHRMECTPPGENEEGGGDDVAGRMAGMEEVADGRD